MLRAIDGISTVNDPFDILVLGNIGVGKTTLIQKYTLGNQPVPAPDTSECITFKSLELPCDCSQNAKYQISSASIHKLISILDSSAEINDLLTSASYQVKNARAILFTYAIDNLDSFEALDYTINCTTSLRSELPPCLVVCLKLDKNIDRQVLFEQGKELASACGAIDFIETCAVSQESVDHVFAPLVEQVLRIQDEETLLHEEECFTRNTPHGRLSPISSPAHRSSDADLLDGNRNLSKPKTLSFGQEEKARPLQINVGEDEKSAEEKLTKVSSASSVDDRTQSSDNTKFEDARASFRTWSKEKSGAQSGKPQKPSREGGRCCVIC